MANGQVWRNRIVGTADVDPAQLVPSDLNFRRHPGPQQDALSGVIDEIGYLAPVLVQASTDRVIDGHLRVELALRTGQPTIPVQYVDLTDDEANLALATFDPLSAMAYHDAANLKALLDEVSTADAAVMTMLSDLAESAGVVPPNVEFKEYDESVAGTVEYHECPECGHRFPK
ncbi:MAG: ParB N-terminal domain-containing protein [Thermomicrobiales bacterium]|nr:ParB N-terminal domain-containing protein [Thermomicrobiales bacterium]